MNKLLVLADEEGKEYWSDKIASLRLPDFCIAKSENESDINILLGHELYISKASRKLIVNTSWIQLLSAGLNEQNILNDLNNLILTTSKGIHGEAMFEYILHCIFLLFNKDLYSKKSFELWQRIRRKVFFNSPKNILILGCGNIGSHLANKFSQMGNIVDAVVFNYRKINGVNSVYTDLSKLELNQYDLIISTLPLTCETENYFSSSFFSQLNTNSIFVNLGRGETVVDKDLLSCLEKKQILGAILDVHRSEPVKHPSFYSSLDNCICTPHISGYFEDSHDMFLSKFKNDYKRFCNAELVSEIGDKY